MPVEIIYQGKKLVGILRSHYVPPSELYVEI